MENMLNKYKTIWVFRPITYLLDDKNKTNGGFVKCVSRKDKWKLEVEVNDMRSIEGLNHF